MGGTYGWINGWVAICAYAVANTTIAYLGAPWALTLAGIAADAANAIVATGAASSLVCARSRRARHRRCSGRVDQGRDRAPRSSRRSGSGSRCCSSSASRTSRSSRTRSGPRRCRAARSEPACSPRWRSAAGCSSASTPASARRRRRAERRVTSRGRSGSRCSASPALVILNAFAVTLAHPDPADVVAGRDLDPVATAVVTSFGSWSAKPFAAIVLAPFLACGMAAQALTARTIFSIARDGVLPASRFLRRVDRRGSPVGAIVATTAIGCLGLLLGLNSAAVGSLIAFGTAAIYVAFLLVALAALIARVRGSWSACGAVRLGRAGIADQRAGRRLARASRPSTSRGRARRSRRLGPPGTRSGRRRSCSR